MSFLINTIVDHVKSAKVELGLGTELPSPPGSVTSGRSVKSSTSSRKSKDSASSKHVRDLA